MDTIIRSTTKAITWRLTATITLGTIVYIISGNLAFALGIGGIDIVIKLLLYIAHERVWNQIHWGLQDGQILWFTGLPAAGKTTIALQLKEKLKKYNRNIVILDGDVVRKTFPEAGFSREERNEHIKRVGYVAKLFAEQGFIVLCSFISPFEESREFVKNLYGNFKLIYLKCPVDTCIKRDPKGLYKRAIAGELENFTGISQEYEEPANPNIVVNTGENSVEESLAHILSKIR
jgi:adenylylsulfate kinase